MADMWETYVTDLHDNFKTMYANWPPNVPIRLGDFGTLGNKILHVKGNVADIFGIKFKERPGTAERAQYSYRSAESTEVTFKAQGQGGTGGVSINASVAVAFSSKNAVFFNAAACEHRSIEDEISLGKDVMQLFEKGQWDDDWVIVTRLISSAAATVAIAASASASITFEADAKVPRVDLANAGIKLTTAHEKNIGFSVATEALTPLLGYSKIQPGWWPWGEKDWRPMERMAAGTPVHNSLGVRKQLAEAGVAMSDAFHFGRLRE